jgi:sortase (surface protein transpeptidase)
MTPGRARLAAGVAAVALVVGCSAAGARHPQPSPPVSSPTQDQAAKGVEAAGRFRSVRGYRATPVPARVEIPKIAVASTLEQLGRAPDRTVQVPSDWNVAGWYAGGPRPGDPGSAVILGHVDSKRGPAVFFRLHQLHRGDAVTITRADGSSVRFVVERTEQYPKRRFPTDEVYYPTLTPALRLVTCGGQFDHATGHYRSNVIVFATMAP